MLCTLINQNNALISDFIDKDLKPGTPALGIFSKAETNTVEQQALFRLG